MKEVLDSHLAVFGHLWALRRNLRLLRVTLRNVRPLIGVSIAEKVKAREEALIAEVVKRAKQALKNQELN
jgi:hypothetical protein